MNRSIAVIGSFRQHNEKIQGVCTQLRAAGLEVTSPQGADLIEPGVDFVRFSTDAVTWSDPAIQSLAMHRILRADLVYVVAPAGYIGRTTCYEVGRIIQNRKPIFFSEFPLDLPLHIPEEYVLDESMLIDRLVNKSWVPKWLYEEDNDQVSALERGISIGKLLND